jgi:hypothetical protein
MNLTDRDRKLLMIVVPLVLVLAYWFLLLSPKREDATKLGEQVAAAETARDQAVAQANQQAQAKDTFERDYTEIVRLGKAIPPTVDMASLLVQVDSAAKGTDIVFDKIVAGERVSAAGESAGGSGGQGGEAQSSAGKAADKAEDAKAQTEDAAQKSDSASNAQGSEASAGGAAATPPPGLDVVPLQMTFTGTFFDLADFMHRLKRYVQLRGENVEVRGRLMRIESLKLVPLEGTKLTADLSASVYLSPKAEGTTAGATPQGPAPAPTTPASGSQPAPGGAPSNTAAVAR